MQKYDLFLILSHNLSETEAPAKVESLKNILASMGAEGIEVAILGRQKLAYPVKGERAGFFVNMFFSFAQEKVGELKNILNLDNEVARFMFSLKRKAIVPAETSAVTSVFEKRGPYQERKPFVPRAAEKVHEKIEEKKEKVEGKELNLEDINKKIDEILQQDTFVV